MAVVTIVINFYSYTGDIITDATVVADEGQVDRTGKRGLLPSTYVKQT